MRSADPEGAEGRLLYLAENLASLHAAPDLAWLAGRFEFLGEKTLGARISVLAVSDESEAYRPVVPSGVRPATIRAAWDALDVGALASNAAAHAIFECAVRRPGVSVLPVEDLFPSAPRAPAAPVVLLAPVAHNREAIGVGIFVVEPGALHEQIAAILAAHAGVAIHQLRQLEEARRLHSVDPVLWIPDETFLVAQLRREVSRARRYRRELGVALLRVENEPELRRQFGDFFTDHLMRRIGAQLQARVRDSDVLGAIGRGYAIIHNETSLDGTMLSGGRLRNVVIQMVRERFPEAPALDVSLAVAAFPASADTVEDLLEQLNDPDIATAVA